MSDDIYDKRSREYERELLIALWQLADHRTICFVSIDLEGPNDAITELGVTFQRKNQTKRLGRHFVVRSTQHLKKKSPKVCGFGFSSEEVDSPEDLYTVLEDFFDYQRRANSRVVLTGFDIRRDLGKLEKYCGWQPPRFATLVDAASIFRIYSGKSHHPTQEAALAILGFQGYPTAPFHNAVNDAWYALELLFRKAEQALGQLEGLIANDTIDWLEPTRTLPLSPINTHSDGDSAAPAAPPFPSGLGLPPRPDFLPRSDLPPGHGLPPRPNFWPGMSSVPLKRKRSSNSQRTALNETTDETDATLSSTPVDRRPEKRQKLTEESTGDGPVDEGVSVNLPTVLAEANNYTRCIRGQDQSRRM